MGSDPSLSGQGRAPSLHTLLTTSLRAALAITRPLWAQETPRSHAYALVWELPKGLRLHWGELPTEIRIQKRRAPQHPRRTRGLHKWQAH